VTNEDHQNSLDSARLMNESVAHEVHFWIEALDKAGLTNLGMILHAAISSPGYGTQVIGMIEGELRHRFGRCYVCGEDHDAEKNRSVEQTAKEMGVPIPGTPFHTGDTEAFDALNIPERTFVQYMELCKKYNVTSAVEQNMQVFCKTCNMPYPDLDDRMIKEPDDCSGCQEWNGKGVKFAPPPQ
jgi:hypothetical protein